MVSNSGKCGCWCVCDGSCQCTGGFCLCHDFIDVLTGSTLGNANNKGIPEGNVAVVKSMNAWRGQTTGEARGDLPEVLCIGGGVVGCSTCGKDDIADVTFFDVIHQGLCAHGICGECTLDGSWLLVNFVEEDGHRVTFRHRTRGQPLSSRSIITCSLTDTRCLVSSAELEKDSDDVPQQ